MICLYCKTELKGDPPLECAGCGMVHESRPPVVGVNHMSQLLSALDMFAEEELEVEEFETVAYAFCDMLEDLAAKWQLREMDLKSRLSAALAAKFGNLFGQMDEAFVLGFQGVEWIEAILAGDSDDFEQAEACLVGFFRGVCASSAAILDGLDEFDKNSGGSGALFNLPSV